MKPDPIAARFTPWVAMDHRELGWAVVRHERENSSWGRWFYPSNGDPMFYPTEAEASVVAERLNRES
jgi:hypothetical protein